jgi:hypothetical protein
MPDNARFAEFLTRLRSGDARAADELVQDYESAVRVVIRARLTDPAGGRAGPDRGGTR